MSQIAFDTKSVSKKPRDTGRFSWVLYILIVVIVTFIIGWKMAPRFIGYYVEVALLSKPLFPPPQVAQRPR